MWAAERGRTDTARLLLDRGADIQHADRVSTGTRPGGSFLFVITLLSLSFIYLSIYPAYRYL